MKKYLTVCICIIFGHYIHVTANERLKDFDRMKWIQELDDKIEVCTKHFQNTY